MLRYTVETIPLVGTETAAAPATRRYPAGAVSITIVPQSPTVQVNVRIQSQSDFLQLLSGRSATFGDDPAGRKLSQMDVDLHAASAVTVQLIIGVDV